MSESLLRFTDQTEDLLAFGFSFQTLVVAVGHAWWSVCTSCKRHRQMQLKQSKAADFRQAFYGHMHLLLAEYFTVTEAGMGAYRSTVWHQLTCSSAVFAWSWPLSALYFSPGVVSCYVIGARGLYQLTLLWSVCRGLKNEMKLEMECKNFLLERGCLLFLSSLLLNVISIALTYLIGSLKWETKKLMWSRNKKWRL